MSSTTLYLMLGYPGSGKTTASKAVAAVTGATHLWADQVRREMFGTPSYSHDENRQLYDELNHQAEELLQAGTSVVFDTSFNYYADRQSLRAIAARNDAAVRLLWVQAPKELAQQRATTDAHDPATRRLGIMAQADFERLSGKLEEPHDDEPYIVVDGTKISSDYITALLKP